jgi:hypothetical protein
MTSHDGGDWNGCPNCGGTRGTAGDTIERIARAIHAVRAALIFAWDDETESVRDLFRGYARAAVAAMPNPGPQRAVDGVSGGGGTDDTSGHGDEALRVNCGNCGSPYPGDHVFADDGVYCPTHTAAGTTSVIHQGFLWKCHTCAARSGGTR